MNEAAMHAGKGRKAKGPSRGFCFKFKTLDGKRRVFVNVGGHDSIEMPQGHSGQTVDAEFVSVHGVDNLQVPIAVGPVVDDSVAASSDGKSAAITNCAVDVVVHSCISDLCQCVWKEGSMAELPPMKSRLIARMVGLAVEWVKRETGLVAAPATIKVVTDMPHRPAKLNDADTKKREMSAAIDALKNMTPEQVEQYLRGAPDASAETTNDADKTDDELAKERLFTLPKPSSAAATTSTAAPQRRMVVEVQEPVIKRGFLNRPEGPGLYGEDGSKEGVLPDGAGDPLGYLPKALRSKCKVIDAREGTEANAALRKQEMTDELLDSLAQSAKPTSLGPSSLSAPPPPREAVTKPAVRVSNGIVIEDIADDTNAPTTTTRVDFVTVTALEGGAPGLQFVIDLTHSSLRPGITMAELDLTIEPGYLSCSLEEGEGKQLFRFGSTANNSRGATTAQWGLSDDRAASTALRTIDVDATKAKFVKSTRKVVITAPWG